MRGTDYQQSGMFSYISAEQRVSNDANQPFFRSLLRAFAASGASEVGSTKCPRPAPMG